MATGTSQLGFGQPRQASPSAPRESEATATSPPSKRDVASWWRQFKRNTRKEEPKEVLDKPQGIFGVPLTVSIKYANVAISLTNENGESFIYGYVPIVVAKCGVFLKEKATEIEGIFRLNGSAKRIKDLQEIFDSPEAYGKGLDWTGYTVHDAANVLRRYLNQLPEPIVPLQFYERFREPLRQYQRSVQQNGEAADAGQNQEFDHATAVTTYQQLIRELPPLHKQLLLYILDLLAVFASKSHQNRMTSANLAAIFQPGLLSHPQHDMSPDEYKLSQDVLIFLIENQDHFLFGMNGTAADDQTVKEVESGAPSRTASYTNIRRSVSTSSGGPEGIRKSINLRRNVSVSSKHSRSSNNTPTPGTPTSLTGGVYRSNTVPSKMSPIVPPSRYSKVSVPNQKEPDSRAPPSASSQDGPPPRPENFTDLPSVPVENHPSADTTERPRFSDGLPTNPVPSPPVLTPSRERKLSSFFAKSPPPGDGKEPRQPNRLKKKRIPGSASESAQSSAHSLHTANADLSISGAFRIPADVNPSLAELTPKPTEPRTPGEEGYPQFHIAATRDQSTSRAEAVQGPGAENTLRPHGSRTPSMTSRTSYTDQSDLEQADDAPKSDYKDHHRSWRFPRSTKRSNEHIGLGVASPPLVAVNGFGDVSTSSRSSLHQSKTDLPQITGDGSDLQLSLDSEVSNASNSKDGNQGSELERMSLFGKFKAKVAQVRDGAREKEGGRERAKSTSSSDVEKSITASSVPQNGTTGSKEDVTRAEPVPEKKEGISSTQSTPPASHSASGVPPAIPEEPATVKVDTAASLEAQQVGFAEITDQTAESKVPSTTDQPPIALMKESENVPTQ